MAKSTRPTAIELRTFLKDAGAAALALSIGLATAAASEPFARPEA